MSAKNTYKVIDTESREILATNLTWEAARTEVKGDPTLKAIKETKQEVASRELQAQEDRELVARVTAKVEAEGTPDELDGELLVEGDGDSLGEDLAALAEVAPEVVEVTSEVVEDDEDTAELPERPEGVSDLDWQCFTLRKSGATWRHTAEMAGWAWVKGNMDGGRALRAVRRVEKAIEKLAESTSETAAA
jgi:hypothetical protein